MPQASAVLAYSLFGLTVIAQIVAIAMLPLSQGFTRPLYSLASLLLVSLSMFMLARIVATGVNVSTLIPFLSATVPLATVLIGISIFGEAASVAKISLLVTACCLIGAAARLG
jgi:multidrug transporter EmrE-like cation transporter